MSTNDQTSVESSLGRVSGQLAGEFRQDVGLECRWCRCGMEHLLFPLLGSHTRRAGRGDLVERRNEEEVLDEWWVNQVHHSLSEVSQSPETRQSGEANR